MHGTELLQMSWSPTVSRTCFPHLSYDYFNQSRLTKGKIAPAIILPQKAIDTTQKCMLCITLHFWLVFAYG